MQFRLERRPQHSALMMVLSPVLAIGLALVTFFLAFAVMRIDPAVQNGTRTVDVKLDGPLPAGAVPDLSVDGTIEIEHLNNVIYVGRPAFGQSDSTVGLFRLVNGGKEAVRIKVKLGLASVNTVQVLGGLAVGDEVILSDMSRWDGCDRVRLE